MCAAWNVVSKTLPPKVISFTAIRRSEISNISWTWQEKHACNVRRCNTCSTFQRGFWLPAAVALASLRTKPRPHYPKAASHWAAGHPVLNEAFLNGALMPNLYSALALTWDVIITIRKGPVQQGCTRFNVCTVYPITVSFCKFCICCQSLLNVLFEDVER